MGSVSKFGLITINVLVVVFGLCVVGLSAAILSQTGAVGLVVYHLFWEIPLTALIIGIFIFLLGILGLVGAIKEHSCLLKTYAVVVSLLVVVTLVVGIFLLLVSIGVSNLVELVLTDLFNMYGKDGNDNVSDSLDFLQNQMHCCGIESYLDWNEFYYGNFTNVADGCCKNETVGCGEGMLLNPDVENLVYVTGCASVVISALYSVSLALGLTVLGIVLLQVLSIVWACIVARDGSIKKYRHMY